jgi:hypothetical protein
MTINPHYNFPEQLKAKQKMMELTLMVLTWFGIVLQLWLSLQISNPNSASIISGLVMYFGFFTVTTNIFIALVLTVPAFAPASNAGLFFSRPQVLACAATSIALVGLGYHFLLSEHWNPTGAQWLADRLRHYVIPALFCAYCLFFRPTMPLPWWSPLLWSVYPVLYFVYVLIRGEVIGLYPYHFIDVTGIGYAVALRNAIGLWVGFMVAGWVFLGVNRLTERYRK